MEGGIHDFGTDAVTLGDSDGSGLAHGGGVFPGRRTGGRKTVDGVKRAVEKSSAARGGGRQPRNPFGVCELAQAEKDRGWLFAKQLEYQRNQRRRPAT